MFSMWAYGYHDYERANIIKIQTAIIWKVWLFDYLKSVELSKYSKWPDDISHKHDQTLYVPRYELLETFSLGDMFMLGRSYWYIMRIYNDFCAVTWLLIDDHRQSIGCLSGQKNVPTEKYQLHLTLCWLLNWQLFKNKNMAAASIPTNQLLQISINDG